MFVLGLLLLFPSPVTAEAFPDAPPMMPGPSSSTDVESAVMPLCPPLQLLSRDAPAACPEFRLDGDGGAGPSSDAEPSSERAPATDERKPRTLLAALVAATVVAGSAANAFTETPHQSFHVTHEGFFGRDTYVGGADKVSHFVEFAIVTKEVANLYGTIGFSRRDSILLASGVTALAGLMNEIGDGTNQYGFSWEDLTMDLLGIGTAAAISWAGLDDLVGFRGGILLPPAGSKTCCQVQGRGRDYSNEIYTADLQIEGLARRLDLTVGPLRYLLFSATYGTKGYPTGLPESRERQIGFEIGLNFKVILDDLGARRGTWWGYSLHVVFDNFRIPFTSVGYRYDLNHGRWTGPDNGNGFATR
jgi:Predicted periplasmic lipoprotein (DUF2279)